MIFNRIKQEHSRCMTNSRVSKKKHTNSTVDDEVEILKRYLKISVMSHNWSDMGLVGKYRV